MLRSIARRKVAATEARPYALAPTPSDALGPAYRAGAPQRTSLRESAHDGTALAVAGQAVDAVTGRPIPGAQIEVWQTDARGWYSDLAGMAPKGNAKRLWMRAAFGTDDQGRYRFDTILPGHYPLGPFTRPRHIHFLVRREGYADLITQMYFAGDRLLQRRRYADLRALIVTPIETPGRRSLSATFDLVLRPMR